MKNAFWEYQFLEYKKARRTGLLPAFICGVILTSALPLIDMAFRYEIYRAQNMSPIETVLSADWQIMAMFHILFVVAGACFLYHAEYADNAMQRMCTLPLRESGIFMGKFLLIAVFCLLAFMIESMAVAFCARHWLAQSVAFSWSALLMELCKNFAYAYLLMLPAALCSLFVASVCRNMWISLGIGVICVFAATMLPAENMWLSLFPYALPFRIFAKDGAETVRRFLLAGISECLVITGIEIILIRVRRAFS